MKCSLGVGLSPRARPVGATQSGAGRGCAAGLSNVPLLGGVTRSGCSNSPWALDRGEWPPCMRISGWACAPSLQRAGQGTACGMCLAARGPILLVCTTVSPLPSVPPCWAAWQICSLTGSALVAALAQLRWLVGAQGYSDGPVELTGGSVASSAPHSPLSPHTACRLHTLRGMWPGLSDVPLQLQPTLSKLLSDARWRNN